MAVEGMEEESDLSSYICSGQVRLKMVKGYKYRFRILSEKLARIILFHYKATPLLPPPPP